ncbi:MAG: class III extradiol dioxygenase family protein [Burkholderiaceae bacterium]
MATLVGGITTSHVPAIGRAIAKNLQADPYWKPFFDGYAPVHRWLDTEARPDVVVVVYNDHGLNFFLDKMPTFAVGAAAEYRNADEGWGIPQLPAFTGEQDLSWHLIESLAGEDFDLTTCQEMVVDHAFTLPMALLWPSPEEAKGRSRASELPSGGGPARSDGPGGSGYWPVKVVPVCINTVQFPLPSAKRCYALGEAIGRAVRSWPSDQRVLVLGTGGLSHQLDGQRAGFINKDFDLAFMESLVHDPRWATQFSIHELVEKTGTQGVELLMWLTARAALGEGPVRRVHQNYHIPISNTASGLMVLAPQWVLSS